MLSKLLIAWALMAACIAIHAGGLTAALRWFRGQPRSFWGWTVHFSAVAGWTVLLHLLEIAVWALYYLLADAILLTDAMPNLPSALYFSMVTYTTTGYGDLVLRPQFRMLGGIEALTGILMCGWSTGFFFAVVSRMFNAHVETGAP